ncbi:MAG: hypothetical protein EAZ08_07005 [Cytophagales bacterium]|nr:MAG: hypothetical protein EAZ08_07005 [Cytophagales bacterium]
MLCFLVNIWFLFWKSKVGRGFFVFVVGGELYQISGVSPCPIANVLPAVGFFHCSSSVFSIS